MSEFCLTLQIRNRNLVSNHGLQFLFEGQVQTIACWFARWETESEVFHRGGGNVSDPPRYDLENCLNQAYENGIIELEKYE